MVFHSSPRVVFDLIFRHGGDEFSVITPHITREQVAMVGERIIKSFSDSNFDNLGVSLGIADFDPTTGYREEDVPTLINRADTALYQAKATGRNRMVFAAPIGPAA